MTFRQCAESYIASHKAGWRNAKHKYQWPATLNAYAYPVIGALPVQAIDTALVLNVLEPIWATKPETASRVRQRIENILDFAKVRGYRDGAPHAFVFPGPKPSKPVSDMAFLMLLRRMGHDKITAHGFRATFKTRASERASFQNEIVEASLAHIVGGKVEQAYLRGDRFEKRRRLAEAWAAHCTIHVKARDPRSAHEGLAPPVGPSTSAKASKSRACGAERL